MTLRRLVFDDIAPGRDFHAALVGDPPRRADTALHTHDFSEAMYVLEGTGTHWIGEETRPLRAGDLMWIRDRDRHTVFVRPGQKVYFVNIAFRQSVWADFRCLALGVDAPGGWEAAPEPLSVHVPPAQRGACAAAFQDALRAFHARPSRLDLCRFWCEVLPLLDAGVPAGSSITPPGPSPGTMGAGGPAWLARALLEMSGEEAVREGLPRLVSLCGVSPAYLARTLKAHTGQTPTEFVNGLRLEQAAILLTTTPQEIADVALDCGFENLSYFYRLFRRRYGRSPRAYRLAARQAVVP